MTEQQRERDIAEMEAQMVHDTDQYFDARPQLMRTRDKEATFEAGFKAAWEARALSHTEGEAVPVGYLSVLSDGTRIVDTRQQYDAPEVWPLYTHPAPQVAVPERDLLRRYREAVEKTHRTRRAGPAAPNADLNRALVEQEQIEAEIDAMLAAAPTVSDSLTVAAAVPDTGEDIYYLYKEGMYGHGVFWIGSDLEEGKRQANKAASLDMDDYHEWVLYRFSLPKLSKEYTGDAYKEAHTRCHVGLRGAYVEGKPND